jgi:hypothetical protein
MQLGSMLRGEGHVGEHVMLGLVHQPAEFLEPGPQLIGDVPPDLGRRLVVGLDEGLADGGGDNRRLRLWHVGQRIAHECTRFFGPALLHALLASQSLIGSARR